MIWAAGHQLQGSKYVIEAILGQGGFGITYKALHVPLDQQVVIKTPNEYLKNDPDYDKYVKRFIREAQLLAKLSQDPHPHIVRVIDLFQESGTHCLVMEFIPGESLLELVRRQGALVEADAIKYICEIGEALAFVHQAGLIHRDAHPGNIMLRSKGKAVLIDFGIAGELIPTTVSSKYFGSAFAPYEQMKGSREPTVDIYCLAATLYYAVTGQTPVTSLERKLYDAVLAPPRQLNPRISDRLSEGIITGMALEAKDRPQSMQEWLKLLEAPTVVAPASVAPTQGGEFVSPSSNQASTRSSRKSNTKQTKAVPWGLLAVILLGYTFTGYLLAASSTASTDIPFSIVATAGAGAAAGAAAALAAVTGAEALATTVAGAVSIAVALAVGAAAGTAAGAGAGTAAAAGAGTAARAGVSAGAKLLESFTNFHTFLILLGTSWLGLGLGWRLLSIIGINNA